jgi:predicted GIY-YIG superfamily endonuclease
MPTPKAKKPRLKGSASRGWGGKKEWMFYVYVVAVGERLRLLHWLLNQPARAAAAPSRGESFATARRGPWKLIYYEAYLNQEDALGREDMSRAGRAGNFSEHNSDSISRNN